MAEYLVKAKYYGDDGLTKTETVTKSFSEKDAWKKLVELSIYSEVYMPSQYRKRQVHDCHVTYKGKRLSMPTSMVQYFRDRLEFLRFYKTL